MSACSGPAECTRPEQADVDVAVEPDTHLVGRGRAPTAAERRLLDAVAGQALLALRNQQVTTEAADARRRADATELRSALLSAVGHDLRTPLVSIKAAAGSLCDPDLRLSDADRDETDRVRIDLPDDLPEVLADPGLLERVVANLVDNALRHGGGSPATLRGSTFPEGRGRATPRDRSGPATGPGLLPPSDRVELRVVDAVPGVPEGRSEVLFAPFQRLGDRKPGGLGLGLGVARGFTEAMGGSLTAEDTPGGGLTVVVSLPAAARPAPADLPAQPVGSAP